MKDKIIILGHNNPDVDSIISGYLLNKLLKIKGYNIEFVIPDKQIDKTSLDICKSYLLEPTIYQRSLTKDDNKFILVDHFERELNGEIVAIIDHHIPTKNINNKHYYKEISSTTCFYSFL